MENKNLKILLPVILIVVLVAIFLLSQLGAKTSRQQAENALESAALGSGAQLESLPKPAAAVQMGNLNATPVAGSVDGIVSDVISSFSDDTAIAGEGNADAALVTTDDSSINQLMGGFNENQF